MYALRTITITLVCTCILQLASLPPLCPAQQWLGWIGLVQPRVELTRAEVYSCGSLTSLFRVLDRGSHRTRRSVRCSVHKPGSLNRNSSLFVFLCWRSKVTTVMTSRSHMCNVVSWLTYWVIEGYEQINQKLEVRELDGWECGCKIVFRQLSLSSKSTEMDCVLIWCFIYIFSDHKFKQSRTLKWPTEVQAVVWGAVHQWSIPYQIKWII